MEPLTGTELDHVDIEVSVHYGCSARCYAVPSRESRSVGLGVMGQVGSWASSEAVRASMRSNKGRDTRPELALRRAAHALGLRYRTSVRPLPNMRRTADLVFTKVKVAVFVDGCFWHGCPAHHTKAATNAEFWSEKVRRTQERDAQTNAALTEAGWHVIRIWEHDDLDAAATQIGIVVGRRRSQLMSDPRRVNLSP